MSSEQFEESSEGFKNLRKAYEKAISERDAAVKDANDLRGTVRGHTISSKLTELGVNSKIARFIPESVELDKLDTWLGENADVFGITLGQQAPDDTANTAEAAAQQRLSGIDTGGAVIPAGDAAEAKRVASLSKEDLLADIFNAQRG